VKFIELGNGNIVALDGTEYVHLANWGFVTAFGSHTLLGKLKGERRYLRHLGGKIETGMYSCEGDQDSEILMRILPDSEWYAYYRKAFLPALDLSPDNCVRFEIISEKWITPGIEHMSCNEGIKGDDVAAFLADVRSQQSPEEAGLYDLVRKPNGRFENCYRLSGYGYFENEPNLAMQFSVTSYNDKAYSLGFAYEDEYVLPEKWFHMLMAEEH